MSLWCNLSNSRKKVLLKSSTSNKIKNRNCYVVLCYFSVNNRNWNSFGKVKWDFKENEAIKLKETEISFLD